MLLRGGPAWPADAAAAAPTAPSPPQAAAGKGAQIDPSGLLLFSVTIDGLTLTEGLGAYGEPNDPLIPISELSRLLEADVEVLPVERRIQGRLGEARRSLLVDLPSGTARVGPQEVRLTDADYAVTPTEIYLRASAIQKLFPLKVKVLPEELTIQLAATERFPVQQRLARQGRRPEGSTTPGGDEPALKIVQPYALFTPPSFDVVLDSALHSGEHDRDFRYDVRFGGDLAFANLQGFLASDEQGRATSARVLLQRRSIEGRLLGPLHVREIDLGDTFSPGLALGPRSVSGRGVSLSTVPFDRTSVFNHIDLRGELPPGYDVELYVNDILRGSTSQAVNGRYEFLDVPLTPGVNVIRIVTYGPRGERDESVQVVNVGAGLLEKGESAFVFGAVDQDKPVFRLRNLPLSVVVSGGGPIAADGGVRVVAGLNYGLTERLTLALGAAHISRLGRADDDEVTVGGRTSILGFATQADLGVDAHGGEALSLGVAGQVAGVSGVLRHAEYRGGFLDENNTGASSLRNLERRTELTMDTNLDLRGRILPLSLRGIHDGYADGSSDLLLGAQGSSSVGPLLVSAGAVYSRQSLRPLPATNMLSGYVAASTYRGFKWQIRTTFDYEVLPEFKPKFLTVTVDRRLSETWSLRLAAAETLNQLKAWNVEASSIYQTRIGDLALTGQYDNAHSDWRIAAQWSFGLGYNPERRRYELTRSGPGSGGSAIVDAFVDENGDGKRQAGEPGVPKVVVQGGLPRDHVTGPDGRTFVTGLGAGASARLDVSLERVENAQMQTPPSRIDLRPRPGAVARVEYPMRPTGDVAIKVELLRDDGKRVGLASVRLQLVPAGGGTTQEETTEFDGSAIFQALPPATYRLQLEPAQAARLRMHLVQTPSIVIKGDGSFLPDVTVQVKFDPAPDRPAGD
jgi:hypothetical protein